MSTTHDDNTTWRDLAGELTDLQRGTLDRIEQELTDGGVPPAVTAERLLEFARNDVEATLADNATRTAETGAIGQAPTALGSNHSPHMW
jgi:hypothetical protein